MRETVSSSFNDRWYSALAGNTILMKSNPEIWSDVQVAVCRLPSHLPMTEVFSRHDELCLHLRGELYLQKHANGKKQAEYSSPGRICLNPKETTLKYAWDGNDELTIMSLSLLPSLLKQTIAQVSTIDPVRVELVSRFHACDPLIYQLMLAMYTELETGGLFGQPYIEALGDVLVLHLLRHYASMPLQPSTPVGRLSGQQIRQVRDYIYDHLVQRVSIADLATSLGFSVSYFTRLFKEATGLSPYQYVIQCRIERAKHLLRDPHLTIAEVAQRVGFTDQSHLHRHLKRSLGIKPGDLRDERKRGEEYPATEEEYTMQDVLKSIQ